MHEAVTRDNLNKLNPVSNRAAILTVTGLNVAVEIDQLLGKVITLVKGSSLLGQDVSLTRV